MKAKLILFLCIASIAMAAPPKVLMNQEIEVLRGDLKEFHFLVPENGPVKFKGSFKTSGGFNDDINLYIFTQENYVRWYSKYKHKYELRLMKKTEDKFELAAKPGETYYFVFENFFSTVSNKKIKVKLELVPEK